MCVQALQARSLHELSRISETIGSDNLSILVAPAEQVMIVRIEFIGVTLVSRALADRTESGFSQTCYLSHNRGRLGLGSQKQIFAVWCGS